MTDVNYIAYGEDALRVVDSGGDFTEFLALNGYAIGVIIAVIISLVLVILILIFGFRALKKLIP